MRHAASSGEVAGVVNGEGDVEVARHRDRLAGVGAFQLGEGFGLRRHQVGQPGQYLATLGGRRGGSTAIIEGVVRGGDGGIHIVGVGGGHLGNPETRRWIHYRNGRASARVAPAAVDVELVDARARQHIGNCHESLVLSSYLATCV